VLSKGTSLRMRLTIGVRSALRSQSLNVKFCVSAVVGVIIKVSDVNNCPTAARLMSGHFHVLIFRFYYSLLCLKICKRGVDYIFFLKTILIFIHIVCCIHTLIVEDLYLKIKVR